MLRKIIKEKDVRTLCKVLFGIDTTAKQETIIRAIAFEEARKITIRAPTQYGKSISVAMGACLHKLLHSKIEYQLIASLNAKTDKLRSYVAEYHLATSLLSDQLEIGAVGLSRLKAEISKKKLTYNDGSSLQVHSAEGSAMRLMGHGGDVIIVDESGEMTREVFEGMIMRMVAGRHEYMVVEIGNPWRPDDHFAEHWDDPRTPEEGGWLKIQVTLEDALKEGRLQKEFVEERRRMLSPLEFRVLFEAMPPEEAEDQLIRREWIEKAIVKKMNIAASESRAGLDVASFGRDLNVLTKGYTDGKNYVITDIQSWSKVDTMVTVGKVQSIEKNRNTRIMVDATGMGEGIGPRLRETEYENAEDVKVGEKPWDRANSTDNADRFFNKKAQYYWHLRTLFEEGRIQIPRNPHLIKELTSIRYEIQSDRKIRIIDPKNASSAQRKKFGMTDKSPDFADSLVLMCTPEPAQKIAFGFMEV